MLYYFPPMPKVTLVKKELLTPTTVAFYFNRLQLPDHFYPGQYSDITLDIHPTDGLGDTRTFTICSSPLEKDYLMIVAKQGISDYKKAFFNLQVGDTVEMNKPYGGLYFHDDEEAEHIFLAGGIGIVLFYSILTYVAQRNLQQKLTLLVSFSSEEDVIFYEELTRIAKEHENIRVVYSISQNEKKPTTWSGENGRISKDLIAKYVTDLQKPLFWVVGSPGMVSDTEELLDAMGVPLSHIQMEYFDGY